jgi:hypothetical protein
MNLGKGHTKLQIKATCDASNTPTVPGFHSYTLAVFIIPTLQCLHVLLLGDSRRFELRVYFTRNEFYHFSYLPALFTLDIFQVRVLYFCP